MWIDLNGFTIDGPGFGTGEGIATMGFGLRHLHVLGGPVQEMGSHGIGGSGYGYNVSAGNSGGEASGGVDTGGNVCGGTLGCP